MNSEIYYKLYSLVNQISGRNKPKSLVFITICFVSLIGTPYIRSASSGNVRWTDLVIELNDGVKTDAQLTLPAYGEGPYPGILLIGGSGLVDMNGFIPASFTGTGAPSRPLKQVAEYLSERGYAVLRYNKRYVGLNSTVLKPDLTHVPEVGVFIEDAEIAFQFMKSLSEVDPNSTTIFGYSEGGIIAIRLALKYDVEKLVLLSTIAESAQNLLFWQLVSLKLEYSSQELDLNADGKISILEIDEKMSGLYTVPIVCPIPSQNLIQYINGSSMVNSGIDANHDGYIGIENELSPILNQNYEYYIESDPNSPYYDPWIQSHLKLESNADIIENINSSILIIQGEGDTQTPYSDALLLHQRLTKCKHPDTTLLLYPSLGHTFYPVDGFLQPMGPIEEYVLRDIFDWIGDPVRDLTKYNYHVLEQENEIYQLRAKISKVSSEIEVIQISLNELLENTIERNNETFFRSKYIYITFATIITFVLVIWFYTKNEMNEEKDKNSLQIILSILFIVVITGIATSNDYIILVSFILMIISASVFAYNEKRKKD
jgi:hypothetical protein